ncbi:MAG TPA: serine hydrolase [Candidatus Rifleibacterium sp.]|nr:serine hydrolase [Candidatus Rifleibacterium sp.]
MKKITLTVVVFLLLSLFSAVFAGDNADLTPDEAFGRMFSQEKAAVNAMFTEDFLKTVTEKRLHEIISFYQNEVGSFTRVETLKDGYKLHFVKGTVPASLSINEKNLISGLWFGVPEKSEDSFAAILEAFKKSPDRTSVCVLRYKVPATAEAGQTAASQSENSLQPEVVAELNASQPMGIGSTFKLYLLKALEDDVAAGRRSWTDIIELREDWKSFPSGILQDWNPGSRHSLETLAGLMISISDNTATDHIFNLLGAETVRKYLPETCKDTFNTGQLLKMKFFYPEKAAEFIKADQKGKDAILREMDSIIPASIASYSSIYTLDKPVLIDELEWFVSTRKLCETIWTLRDSTRIRINAASGLINRADWHIAGFKGGSEPGVINYTWLLQKTPTSPIYTVSCTANNSLKTIASDEFNLAVTRILNLLKNEK